MYPFRFPRVDPAELGRIEDMIANAEARLAEARMHAWLGEVSEFEGGLRHLRQRADGARRRLPVARHRGRAAVGGEPATANR